MKIGIAQINTVGGDFPGNARRLLHAYRECLEGGADLVMTSALALAGHESWPGEVSRCLQALDYLSTETVAVPFLVGHLGKEGESAVSLLRDGGVVENFGDTGVFRWKDRSIAVSTASDESQIPTASLHLQLLRTAFTDPFPSLKLVPGIPMVRCEAIGGCGEKVYAGRSGFWSSNGERLVGLPAFAEACLVVDLDGSPIGESAVEPLEALWQALILGVRDRMRKGGYLGLTLRFAASFPARLLHRLALEVTMEDTIEVVSLSSTPGDSVRHVDIGGIEKALQQAMESPDPGDRIAIESMVLSRAAERSGHLLLSDASRTDLLTLSTPWWCDLAPFGDLALPRLRELAEFKGLTEGTSAAPRESIIHCYVDQHASFDELLSEGYTEAEILSCLRQVDRTRMAMIPKPALLRFSKS